ncbi:MAG: Acyl carrier protein phosphodiesterase [Frankiales bacterium]|nr:Acyl carrier protein phosphodiesterase [Frankiales bacterium]
MSLFRLDASIRVEGSTSREIADIVEGVWRAGDPAAPVTRRHVGTEPLPSGAWAAAVAASGLLPADQSTPGQAEAVALAATLVDELIDAEALLFAVPLYNFGVSQHFKTWVDLVLTDPRMGPAGGAPLAGKPAVLVTVHGGNYSPGTPREGWDHATGWIRRILEDGWHLDLRVVEREFTLVGVNPSLDAFTELAAELKATAERKALEDGRWLLGDRRAAA